MIRALVGVSADLSGNLGNWSYTYSAMQMAVVRDQPESIKLLVELGADVNQVTVRGFTPILTAVRENKLDLVTLLLELGAGMICVIENGHWSVFDTAKLGVIWVWPSYWFAGLVLGLCRGLRREILRGVRMRVMNWLLWRIRVI